MSASPLPESTPFEQLPRAHGAPLGNGRLRVEPADFQVDEDLGFHPDGEGDHLLLRVCKADANTEWTTRRIAGLAEVAISGIGYAGLKDRHALTTQWFSLPRPPTEPDWSALLTDGIEVLEVHRHRRKLRRGALRGNRFRILVRECALDSDALAARIKRLRARGVPNYFGDQRFGREQSNLLGAHAWFSGAASRAPRHRRSLWLSAARSQIFNEVLAERVRRGDWDQPQPGDRLQLDGSHSHFLAETIDDALRQRAAEFDIHPTGPLWGQGAPLTAGAMRTMEEGVAARFETWAAGLSATGMAQERRALRLSVADLNAELIDSGLILHFTLPAGSYATAVLCELIQRVEE